MEKVLLSLALLCQCDVSLTEIARVCRQVLDEESFSLSKSQSTVSERKKIVELTNEKLATLFSRVGNSLDGTTEADCLTLGRVAHRLKKYDKALAFYECAKKSASTIKPHIETTLVLAQLNRLEEAEVTLAAAEQLFGQDKKLYVMANVMAYRYHALGQYDAAARHYERVVVALLSLVEEGCFYVDHLARVLSHYRDANESRIAKKSWEAVVAEWRCRVMALLDTVDVESQDEGLIDANGCMKSRALQWRALFVIEKSREAADLDEVCARWGHDLITFRAQRVNDNRWADEIVQFVDVVVRELSINMKGQKLIEEVCKLERVCGSDASCAAAREALLVCRDALERHRRLLDPSGRSLMEEIAASVKGDAGQFTLLHVCDPAAKSFDRHLKVTVRALEGLGPGRPVSLYVVAAASKYKRGDEDGQITRGPDAGKRHRASGVPASDLALREFIGEKGLRWPVLPLPQRAEDEKIVPEVPIRLLVSPVGEVVGLWSGLECDVASSLRSLRTVSKEKAE